MTIKEKIIARLNNGFGFNIPLDVKWKTHEARGYYRSAGSHLWYFIDHRVPMYLHIGSSSPATECLKWKRWIISIHEREIFEYIENVTTYDKETDLLEKLED